MDNKEFNFELTSREIDRYSRQLILSNWDSKKQLRLKKLSVFICAEVPTALLYLAGLGIGNIITTDTANIKHWADHARKLNPDINISCCNQDSLPQMDCALLIGESQNNTLISADALIRFDPCTGLLQTLQSGQIRQSSAIQNVAIFPTASSIGTAMALHFIHWACDDLHFPT